MFRDAKCRKGWRGPEKAGAGGIRDDGVEERRPLGPCSPIPRLSELERPRYGVYVPLVPVALAHAALKNEEVDQMGTVGDLERVTEEKCKAPGEGGGLEGSWPLSF